MEYIGWVMGIIDELVSNMYTFFTVLVTFGVRL